VHYTLNQWSKLTVFLEHPIIPLVNNRGENAIRPFVIGRKGWMFSRTV
jgi:transposase